MTQFDKNLVAYKESFILRESFCNNQIQEQKHRGLTQLPEEGITALVAYGVLQEYVVHSVLRKLA